MQVRLKSETESSLLAGVNSFNKNNYGMVTVVARSLFTKTNLVTSLLAQTVATFCRDEACTILKFTRISQMLNFNATIICLEILFGVRVITSFVDPSRAPTKLGERHFGFNWR